MQAAWRRGVVAAAAALTLAGASFEAHALALGAVTVRSALGEPLRAEIEVPQISSEEASAFQASIASPAAFRAAGVEYSAALANVRVTLHRRPNGQAYLRLVGDRPINEPFLGVVVEANWATGRMVRDYTMLVDPPGRGAPPPVTVTQSQAAPSVAIQTTPSPVAGESSSTMPPAAPAPRMAERRSTPQPTESPRPAPRRTPAPDAAPRGDGQPVTVQRGDTAYGIAAANAPEGVSLDQMLVAMLRANPGAFIRGNVNRLRAGAVLDMPSAEQAATVPRRTARRTVVAHSRDFNSFRRGLAQAAPRTQVASADRSASGSVQPQVQDSRPAPATNDRLTISRGGGAAPGSNETRVAQSRQSKEQAERTAELTRNINELARLQGASAAPTAGKPAASINVPTGAPPAAPAPAAPAPAPVAAAVDKAASEAAAAAAATASAAQAAASAAAAAPAAVASAADSAAAAAASSADAAAAAAASAAVAAAPAPAPAPVKPPAPPPPPPPPVEEPSLLDSLTENPLIPAAGLGLLALLGGYGVYRARQKKSNAAPLDSSFIESRLQPDSFFGASGGARVNTRDGGGNSTGNSSMAYSPSQLDAAGDVDPVAEADVYLAYGRDMQAEEILKEALRTHPNRISVHRKLAEIYAKRRDAKALEQIATEAHTITNGDGADWEFFTALGTDLDPGNPLYKPGGKPAPRMGSGPAVNKRTFGADTEPQTAQIVSTQPSVSGNMPLDVDLDLDLDNAPVVAARPSEPARLGPAAATVAAAAGVAGAAAAARAAPAPIPVPPPPTPVAPPSNDIPLDFDLEMDLGLPPAAPAPVVAPAAPLAAELPTIIHAPAAPAPAPTPAAAPEKKAHDSGMIDFDMGALSINPDSRSGDLRTEQPEDADENPLQTKLDLAREFHAIGDTDGARSLVKEVVAEASGALKARAERFLAELS